MSAGNWVCRVPLQLLAPLGVGVPPADGPVRLRLRELGWERAALLAAPSCSGGVDAVSKNRSRGLEGAAEANRAPTPGFAHEAVAVGGFTATPEELSVSVNLGMPSPSARWWGSRRRFSGSLRRSALGSVGVNCRDPRSSPAEVEGRR